MGNLYLGLKETHSNDDDHHHGVVVVDDDEEEEEDKEGFNCSFGRWENASNKYRQKNKKKN